jgi:hypothetical protein
MPSPQQQSTSNRLRDQVRLERDLAAQVLAAEDRLAAATERADAIIAAQAQIVASHQDKVADALINYVNHAGVGIERAAIILDRPKRELAREIRERRSRMSNGTASDSSDVTV